MTTIKFYKRILLSVAISAMGLCLPACDDDNEPQPGTGIETAQWSAVNDADLKGETLIYEFEAPAKWTATSEEDWCEILTPSGYAGLSSLRIKVAPNEGKLGRSTDVSVQIEGYQEPCVLTIRQGEGVVEKGEGRFRDINQWTYELMSENYLWNENIPDLILDHSLHYDRFFESILDGVAEIDDANHEDGFWIDGVRQMYYSVIESNAPASRAAGDRYTDSGIFLQATILGANDDAPCGFAVMWVTPGSPAANAGVVRGDFISKVNNIPVTQTNYQSLGNQVINGNVTIDLNNVEFDNGVATVTNRIPSVLVGKASYVDPAIYKSNIFTASNGKKIGYLLYMGFHIDYDQELIDIFNNFKNEGIDELIVDLRYNIGGHVLSSAVLGTLVAGQPYAGQTYLHTAYNAKRKAAGEEGFYRIGDASNPEMPNGYDMIANALNSSLGLNNIYVICSVNTASASETFINGLRGLGINVNLIGTRTRGKNCGMEGWRKKAGNYTFTLQPITFYCENAKGFRDYSAGFKPDVEYDDSAIYPGNFGTMDDVLSSIAITWATNGQKPNIQSNNASRSGKTGIKVLKSTKDMERPLTRRPGGSRTAVIKDM